MTACNLSLGIIVVQSAAGQTGMRLLSDRQPRKLRIENHSEVAPAIWLHSDQPDMASIVVNIGYADWCRLAYQFGHELGHVLGFGHSDEYFMDNLMRPEGAVMNNDTCQFAALQMPAFTQNPGSTVRNLSFWPPITSASSHTCGLLCLPGARYLKPNHGLHR